MNNNNTNINTNKNENTNAKKNRENLTCFKCGGRGHFASDCPSSVEGTVYKGKNSALSLLTQLVEDAGLEITAKRTQKDERTLICMGSALHSTNELLLVASGTQNDPEDVVLRDTHVLCDNQATVSVFRNESLLNNIRPAKTPVRIAGVGGVLVVNQVGDFFDFGEVYFHRDSPANIICYFDLCRKYTVRYNNKVEDAYVVERKDGRSFVSRRWASSTLTTCARVFLVSTTQWQSPRCLRTSKVSRRDKSRMARRLFAIMARPAWSDFISMLGQHSIAGCPVTVQDAQNALSIYGPDLGVIKGRTVRETPARVRIIEATMPIDLTRHKERVVLSADIMFLDGIPFLIAISRDIKLITCFVLDDRSAPTLLVALRKMIVSYAESGFKVRTLLTDGERGFVALGDSLREIGVELNLSSKNDHAPEAERAIRLIKERFRATVNMLPYTTLPTALKVQLVYYSVFWVNNVPKRTGISQTMSPREIVKGRKLDYKRDCALEFGAYVQMHEKDLPTNSMRPRTTGAICVGPSGNAQGDMFFYSLSTQKVRQCGSWTELPVPAEVITHLESIAHAEKKSRTEGYVFRRGDGTEVLDEAEDGDNTRDVTDDTVDDEETEESIVAVPVENDDECDNPPNRDQ